jgi:hypothetical protein
LPLPDYLLAIEHRTFALLDLVREAGLRCLRTCDAGGTLATTGIPPVAGLPASGTGDEPGPGPDAHGRDDVVGRWLWFNQKKVVLHGDGRATVDGETTQGAWRWLGGDKYVVERSHGEIVDNLSLAPGKSRLAGTNQFGVSVTADRMGPPGRWAATRSATSDGSRPSPRSTTAPRSARRSGGGSCSGRSS